MLNYVAEVDRLDQAEAFGRPLGEVFRTSTRDRAPAEDPVRQGDSTTAPCWARNHTALVARDGGQRSIATAPRPSRGDGELRASCSSSAT